MYRVFYYKFKNGKKKIEDSRLFSKKGLGEIIINKWNHAISGYNYEFIREEIESCNIKAGERVTKDIYENFYII